MLTQNICSFLKKKQIHFSKSQKSTNCSSFVTFFTTIFFSSCAVYSILRTKKRKLMHSA